ncbi:hypothetical protein CTAYLR_009808 [Chrysophaeum taylorii]|uniref:PARP catalytic domain-containing protein n=1 Tax=Chrysophaeum taylorii TaxID=2483200 RepID=A0AAD7U654_9STRA|nr:hypothetical protein CTAYLR_009808 [Chrysophaeum taylorii]
MLLKCQIITTFFFLVSSSASAVVLSVTADVEGAVYPMTPDLVECGLDSDPCACWGGAARREAAMVGVRIDAGNFATGTGLFYATNASRLLFEMSNYSGAALGFRDDLDDNKTLVATNLDGYPIMARDGKFVTLALRETGGIGYERALTRALDRVEVDDLVAVIVRGFSKRDAQDLAGGSSTTTTDAVVGMALKFVRLDVVLVVGYEGNFTIENWAGRNVVIAGVRSGGAYVTRIDVAAQSRSVVELGCDAPEDADVKTQIDEWKRQVDERLGDPVRGHAGYVSETLDILAAGYLFADALEWYAGADLGFVSTAELKADVPKAHVLESHLLATYPSLAEVVIATMRGTDVEDMVARVVAADEFPAVPSRGVLVEWDGTRLESINLDPSLVYTVAMSRTLAAAGTANITRRLGVAPFFAAARYLEAFHDGTTGAYYDGAVAADPPRIVQNAPRAPIALLCPPCDGLVRKEECGRAAAAAVELGLSIEIYEVESTRDILKIPKKIRAVVAARSHDVAALASEEARAVFENVTGYDGDYVVVSPAATTTTSFLGVDYPLLVRLATPEPTIATAVVSLTERNNWHRVVVVHDDTLWGQESAQAFLDVFRGEVVGDACVGCRRRAGGGISFDPARVRDVEIPTTGVDAVYVAAYPESQRLLFKPGVAWLTNLPTVDAILDVATSDDDLSVSGFLESTAGYVATDTYSGFDVDGDPTTVAGYSGFWVRAVSLLAATLENETNATRVRSSLLSASSSPLSLDLRNLIKGTHAFETIGSYDGELRLASEQEDDDDSSSSSSSRSPSLIAILVAACSCVVACCSVGLGAWVHKAELSRLKLARLSATLNAHCVVEAFDPLQHEERSAHVLLCQAGAKDIVVSSVLDQPANTVVFERSEMGEAHCLEMWYWESRARAGDDDHHLSSSSGTALQLPDDDEEDVSWIAYDDLVQDQISEVYHRFVQLPENLKAQLRRQETTPGSHHLCTLTVQALTTTAYQQQQQQQQQQSPTSSVEDDDNETHDSVILNAAAPAGREINVAHMTQRNLVTGTSRRIKFVPDTRVVRFDFYWRENLRHLVAKWNNKNTFWVRYEDPFVQRALGDLYLRRRKDSNAPKSLALDAYNQISRGGIEAKYEVDLELMCQTRLDTGFRRPVCAMIQTDYVQHQSAAAVPALSERVVRGLPSVRNMPADIQGADCLALERGATVAVLSEHEEGDWFFGCLVVSRRDDDDDDDDEPRLKITDDAIEMPPLLGRSASAAPRMGWFPKQCVKPSVAPTTFSTLDFLLPPKHWDVSDETRLLPLVVGSREWRDVSDPFHPHDVRSVTRIENLRLWRPYAAARHEVQKRTARPDKFPLYLEPPSAADATRIVDRGLDVHLDATRGDFGHGTYLFTTYEPSHDHDDLRHVLVFRVVVGAYCGGSPEMQLPPLQVQAPTLRYDATVDDDNDPSLFVLYDTHHVYPAYLVTLSPSLSPSC